MSRLTTTVEPVAAVRARQVVWVTWMSEACAGLTDTDLLVVTSQHTPFGTYLHNMRPATAADIKEHQ